MKRTAFVFVVAAALLSVLPACIDLAGLLEPPECEGDRDCDDDEECNDGECESVDDDDGNEGEGEGEGDVGEPGGPVFLELNTNITTATPSDEIIFTAVLTDPDGVDDIIGGSLVDPTTTASYGAFQTSASEGSYELRVTWDEINLVAPIDFADSIARGFTAHFFDQAGHISERTLNITLTCDGAPACDGDCGGARCGDDSCTTTDGNFGFDPAGNGICNDQCRPLVTATDCGACNAACLGGNDCVVVGDPNNPNNALPFCGCGDGGDCPGENACFAILSDSSQAICQPSQGVGSMSPGFPDTPQVFIGGQLVNLCDGLTQSEANLFCTAAGLGVATLETSTAGADIGFDPNCAGQSSFTDCVFAFVQSCVPASIRCGE